MNTRIIILAVLAFFSLCFAPKPTPYTPSEELLDAIQMVESGKMGNATPDGDGGKAIGPLQIHQVYFNDAAKYDPSLGSDYSKCRDVEFSRRVVKAYMARYVKDGSDETAVRMHNGGCGIMNKRGSKAWNNTTKYLEKVQKALTAR